MQCCQLGGNVYFVGKLHSIFFEKERQETNFDRVKLILYPCFILKELRTMKWVGNVAPVGEIGNAYTSLVGKLGGRVILKWIFEK